MVEKFPTYQQANNNKIELLCINISSPKRGRVTIPPSQIKVALGYCKTKDLAQLVNTDKFYFHAITKNNKVKTFPVGILDAKILTIYTGSYSEKLFTGFYGEIKNIKLMHKSDIPGKENSKTEFYYFVELTDSFKLMDGLKSKIETKLLFDSEDEINPKMIRQFLPAITTWDKIWRR